MQRTLSSAAIGLAVLTAGTTGWLAMTGPAALAEQTSARAEAESPAVIAVKFHADWCGYCKAMGPIFTDLENKFDGKPVLFVTLDLTNQSTKRRAEYLAATLGLGSLWVENNGSTGTVRLVDFNTRSTVATLTSSDDIKAMGAAIDRAIQSSN